jgi:hypothetical protein
MHCIESICLQPNPGFNLLLINLVPLKINLNLFKTLCSLVMKIADYPWNLWTNKIKSYWCLKTYNVELNLHTTLTLRIVWGWRGANITLRQRRSSDRAFIISIHRPVRHNCKIHTIWDLLVRNMRRLMTMWAFSTYVDMLHLFHVIIRTHV